MHIPLITAAIAALQVTFTLAGVIERDVMSDIKKDIEERDLEERAPLTRKCGSVTPPQPLVEQAQAFSNQRVSEDSDLAKHAPIVVDTYFHVVTSTTKQGRYTQTQLNNQLAYMNNAYSPHGITFKLLGTDFTVNNDWATGNFDSTMKPALRKGTYSTLNVYFLSDLGGGLLGICPFPTDARPGSSAYKEDGCNVLADSLPGGSATNMNLGGTGAHEVGHWMGLFHVFQGQSCSGPGDSVTDTPIQSSPTSGCPTTRDTCPDSPGPDSINNYMDYSDDRCYTSFTSGQETRMFQMWDTYRAGK